MGSSMKLTDIMSSESDGQRSRKGCWIGVGGAVAIVFGAVLLAVVVGLFVFYLHPDRKTTDDALTTTTTTITTMEPPPVVDYRLPGDLIPYSYDARLRPNFYDGNIPEDSSINGSVKIQFGVKRSTSKIVLHSKTLVVKNGSISVTIGQEKILKVLSTLYDPVTEFFTITLNESLQVNNNYSVYMEFTCSLKTDLTGVYLSTYTNSTGQTVYIVTSQAQATEARKMFPCFDEPAMKAVFNLTIERRRGWKSFSNTEIDYTYNISGDWVADKYLPTPPMSTYLLAVVISQFDCVTRNTTDYVLVSVCSRREYINQTKFANSVAAEMQDYFRDYYNISYPLPKMEHMAVPDFSAGAMENWGLILYRETALLFDDYSSSAYYRQRVAIVVAHELAHQWFGNLVTPGWWDDIWLNEGFASYMEITCTNNSFPDWDMDGQFVVDDLQSVFTTDSLASSHPIYQEVNDPAQINELFDSIAYSKGASIIRMMRYFLGDEIFRWGISDYLKNRSYTAAHHLDLFAALTESAQKRGRPDINVTEIMQTWLLQLGYPVIDVTYDKTTGLINLRQQHFLLNRNETPPKSPYDYQWIVPISVVTSQKPDFANPTQSWLNKTQGTLQTDKNANWVIVNSMQQYYYRVNYDETSWNTLVNQLMNDHSAIHSNNRAQLIDDSFNLGRAGYIGMETFLDITKYLTQETDYVPWRATWKDMDFLKRMLELSGNYRYLRDYVQQQVKPIYSLIGWNSSDIHLEQRHQAVVLDMACSYGYDSCLREASSQFSSWMSASDTTNPIDPNVRSVAYCSGIEAGGATEWQFGWERFLSAPSSSEATTLLQALACTKETFLLSGYLEKAMAADGIRLQDFRTVVTSVARNPAGRSLAWDLVRENWHQLLEWFKDSAFTLPSLIRDVTQSFSTELELSELEYFRDNAGDLATATRAVDQAIENTKFNIEWRRSNEALVSDWLKNNTNIVRT